MERERPVHDQRERDADEHRNANFVFRERNS
jgi:hypothetical protein